MATGGSAGSYRAGLLERSPDCAGATDIGVVRESNEDAFWIAPDASVLVVADGLGGLPAGEIASARAVADIAEFLQTAGPSSRGLAGGASDLGGDATGRRLAQLAVDAVARAQRGLLDAATRRPECRGMATTVVLALLVDHRAVVLHVGDSRAQLWRAGRVVRTTYDHNIVGDLMRMGAITPDEARHHPARNVVREALGFHEGYQSECEVWPLEAGDLLLLCTDGVSDVLGEATVAHLLVTEPTAARAASGLVEVATRESGCDNATAIVLRVT